MIPGNLTAAVRNRLDVMESALPDLAQFLTKLQQGDLGVVTKSNDFDLVTKADVASEERLVGLIREHFPDDLIVAEEGANEGVIHDPDSAYCWVLDPIDGTTNFANRLPIWAISIGLLFGDQQVGAIVCAPGLGLRYRSVLGGGATCNGQPISVNAKERMQDGIIVTGFPYDRAKRAEPLCQALGNMLRSAGGVRRLGAASLDFCFVADGRFTGYYEMGLKPWDYAAGSLIATEAGAVVSDLSGGRLDIFGSQGVIASNGKIHAELVREAVPMLDAIAL